MRHPLQYMPLFFMLVLMLGTAEIQPAQSAQCVNVSFLDADGILVPTEAPIVGIMLGGVPAVEGEVPEHASRTAGTVVPCPQELLDQVSGLFDETCLTADRRANAARLHGSGLDVIKKGCNDMSAALNNSE